MCRSIAPAVLLAVLSSAACGADRPVRVDEDDEEEPPAFAPDDRIWPLARSTDSDADSVHSPFGPRYIGRYDFHAGIDLPASRGTAVYAVQAGRAILVKPADGGSAGNKIVIDHGDGRYTNYLHLDRFSISVGDDVATGDEIGAVGSTGASDPHLHLGYFYAPDAGPTDVPGERSSRNPIELLSHAESPAIDATFADTVVFLSVPLQTMKIRRVEVAHGSDSSVLDYYDIVTQGGSARDEQVQNGVRIAANRPVGGSFTLRLGAPDAVERIVLTSFEGDTLLDARP